MRAHTGRHSLWKMGLPVLCLSRLSRGCEFDPERLRSLAVHMEDRACVRGAEPRPARDGFLSCPLDCNSKTCAGTAFMVHTRRCFVPACQQVAAAPVAGGGHYQPPQPLINSLQCVVSLSLSFVIGLLPRWFTPVAVYRAMTYTQYDLGTYHTSAAPVAGTSA